MMMTFGPRSNCLSNLPAALRHSPSRHRACAVSEASWACVSGGKGSLSLFWGALLGTRALGGARGPCKE
eukprot:8570395-Pyramimonas_sp.AAC.1